MAAGAWQNPQVTEDDVRAAQTTVDALVDVLAPAEPPLTGQEWTAMRLQARGVLASFAAEVRYAGYLEGMERGRKVIGQAVREALEGEGV